MAESALEDGIEFPESEVALMGRALTGIRDCEFRWDTGGDILAARISGVGETVDTCIPRALAVTGFEVFPSKSLFALRCIPSGREVVGRSVLTPSKDGVRPIYHAVGDEGDIPESSSFRSLGNIGFGLCMLPSEPLRLRGPGMPYPGSGEFVVTDKISPNNRGRNNSFDGGS